MILKNVRSHLNISLFNAALRYFLAGYVMGVANDLADARGTLMADTYAPLPDLAFDFVPYMPEMDWAADSLVKALYILLALRVFLAPQRRRLAIAFIDMHTSLMLLRSIVVALTTFPAPSPTCEYKLAHKPAHFLIEPLKRMLLRSDGMSSWCHDMLFSGHAVFLVLAALFLNDSAGHWLWRVLACSMSAAGLFVLLAARMHYSVDVVMAIMITTFVYSNWRQEIVRRFLAEGGEEEDDADAAADAAEPDAAAKNRYYPGVEASGEV